MGKRGCIGLVDRAVSYGTVRYRKVTVDWRRTKFELKGAKFTENLKETKGKQTFKMTLGLRWWVFFFFNPFFGPMFESLLTILLYIYIYILNEAHRIGTRVGRGEARGGRQRRGSQAAQWRETPKHPRLLIQLPTAANPRGRFLAF